MSIPAINWCIEQKDLPPGEWVVLFHLCHCHNHETGRCDPSQDYLATMTNMGERTVRRHLSSLEMKGRISRKKRGIADGGRLSDYFILGHEPAKLADNLSGQSVQSNRPNGAENMHEMAGKHGRNRKEQENKDQPTPDPRFSEFWERWPMRKVARKKAEASFKRLSSADKREAINKAEVWARAWRAAYPTASDVHPTTYLNGKRWEDEFNGSTAQITELDAKRARWRKIAAGGSR